MYLYVAFFNEDFFSKGHFYLSGQYLDPVKLVFPDYQRLKEEQVEGCISFFKGRKNRQKNCYALKVKNIIANNELFSFDFDIEKELDISSESIDESIYRFALKSNWINHITPHHPLACLLQKSDFDMIRKGNQSAMKASRYCKKLDHLKKKSDWAGIVKLFDPLEKVQQNEELWNNANDLYNLAFACSKLGEQKNGRERDTTHISEIKKYRNFSISFYKRCCELEPGDFRYPSSLGYRYYLNVLELSKPKGRRDGNIAEEMAEAIKYIDLAISFNPNSIKDNYRKGKLILEKQTENFIFTQRNWNKDTFAELRKIEEPGISSLSKVINLYENNLSSEQKKRYFKEYVKSLYCLGSYYLRQSKPHFHEYACSKLLQTDFVNRMGPEELIYLMEAEDILKKCFEVESDVPWIST